TDTGTDAGRDTGTDTGPDTGTDAGTDTGPDTGTRAGETGEGIGEEAGEAAGVPGTRTQPGPLWTIEDRTPRVRLARHAGPDTDTPHHGAFDLGRGPLLRAVLHDRGPGRSRVLHLAVHHLVVDGVSWRVLLEDLDRAYRARREGRDGQAALPAKSVPLRHW
ncbi:condensation domain-containing protein, partial [Streptomyces sp. 8P21H-1]|uniref:condensation domain-containing protein n=1 Tax=Streptomyces sp. 8P21H-1 TaxID=2737048 RepID=UPI0015710D92